MRWPAILKVSGDPELALIKDQAQWDSDPHLLATASCGSHMLIDYHGNTFELAQHSSAETGIEPQPLNTSMELNELLGLLTSSPA